MPNQDIKQLQKKKATNFCLFNTVRKAIAVQYDFDAVKLVHAVDNVVDELLEADPQLYPLCVVVLQWAAELDGQHPRFYVLQKLLYWYRLHLVLINFFKHWCKHILFKTVNTWYMSTLKHHVILSNVVFMCRLFLVYLLVLLKSILSF